MLRTMALLAASAFAATIAVPFLACAAVLPQ